MLSIQLSFLVCILFVVRSSVSVPTKAEICAKPVIEGGLVVTDIKDNNKTQRYLFWGQFVAPYSWERRQIDWQKIVPINEKFKGLPNSQGDLRFAFARDNTSFLAYERDRVNSFRRSGNDFTFVSTVELKDIGFEFLIWTLKTTGAAQQQEKEMIFMDSTSSISQGSGTKEESVNYPLGTIKMTMHQKSEPTKFSFPPQIFPNTFIYENLVNIKHRIPIEFDAFYQTLLDEVVFFKGESACITQVEVQPGKESEYCHTWVDTRTLIGCTTGDSVNTGAEVFPGEPEDTASDF